MNLLQFTRLWSALAALHLLSAPAAHATWATAESTNINVETRWILIESGNIAVDTRDWVYLTINAPHGTVTGAGQYDPDTNAELTATPDPGYVFSEWTGDATGNTNPFTILMDTNKSVTAVFGQDTADPDNDNLTNYQEIVTYGTNPALWDTDDDGFSDGYEVSTGYDPKSNTSSPDTKIAIYTAVEVEFGAGLGKTYRVESSTDLQTWTPVESNIPGNGGTITRLYSIRSIPHRYFRAVRENP